MNDSDEPELWHRARRNDGDAFGRIFDLHRDRVYRRAFGLLADRHDAEDVTAAAFFELWRKRRSVTPVRDSLLPWLLVTTVNLSRNLRRSTARYQRFLRTAPRESTTTDGPDAADGETHDRLAASLADLSPVDGALLVLTALDDVPVAQAAEAVGVTPGAARVRLHRARARLRVDLRDLEPASIHVERTR